MNRQQLETAAIDAHQAGMTWAEFWQTIAPSVAEAEPCDRQAYKGLVARLTALVTADDLDGMEPIANAWPRPEPWELAEDISQEMRGEVRPDPTPTPRQHPT